MVVGIGTDIVNIERIEHVYNKFGDDFIHKNFHKLEISYLSTLSHAAKIGYLAKRFAAKEAVAKSAQKTARMGRSKGAAAEGVRHKDSPRELRKGSVAEGR